MEKKKVSIWFYFPLVILVAIGIRGTIKELKEQETKRAERSWQIEMEKVDYFMQPMVRNGNSFLIGYLFEDAHIDIDEEAEEISYLKHYDSPETAIRIFDSLFVEICKHHCDSIAPHKFTGQYNRIFKCSHTGASVVLKYQSREGGSSLVKITYDVPQKLGQGVGEEWQQYLRVK